LPLQEISLEQLALLLGAASRDAFAQLRARSGTLPASGGRSRLGALLDPAGLLRDSVLVNPDERDRQALEAARKLADIAASLLDGQTNGSEPTPSATATAAAGAAPSLTAAQSPSSSELRDLATTLSRKVWSQRNELQIVSRRLAAKVLDQTVERVRAAAAGRGL